MAKPLKITKLPRKNGGRQVNESLQNEENEIKRLELILSKKQDELFQLQRNACIPKMSLPKQKKKAETFIRPEKIILENSIATLKSKLKLMTMLSGIDVESYVADDHCCIVYHMQHDSEHMIKHGLRINLKSGINEVSKVSFPLGFNFNAVMEDIDNIMAPKSLGAIKKALDAYYDRLNQYHALKRMLPLEALMCKSLDGSHMKITFEMEDSTSLEEDREYIQMVLILDYKVCDIRPKTCNFMNIDVPEDVSEALTKQCKVFKRKPLATAFQEVFIDGVGVYRMVQEISASQTDRIIRRPKKKLRPNKHNYNNDDTFHPEDCSGQSDDDVDE